MEWFLVAVAFLFALDTLWMAWLTSKQRDLEYADMWDSEYFQECLEELDLSVTEALLSVEAEQKILRKDLDIVIETCNRKFWELDEAIRVRALRNGQH